MVLYYIMPCFIIISSPSLI